MRILMISSYPPVPCGIGAYAAQQVATLRESGQVVDVLAHPAQGPDGDFTLDLRGGWRLLSLLRLLWVYDRVFIHFTPSFFFDSDDARDRIRTSLSFLLVSILFGRRINMVIHETEFRVDERAKAKGLRRRLDRWTWSLFKSVIFHSERELRAFCEYYGFQPGRRGFEIVAPDHHYRPHATGNPKVIRAEFGIPPDAIFFLCIGFIQPHKGYDRLLRAMSGVKSEKIVARVVGSVRINWQPALDYARDLHALADSDPRAGFVESFVSDEEFDRWIIAADYVVIPYHEIWSSAVAARAKLHSKPVIASLVGALPEQLPKGSHTFRTDDELRDIIDRIASEKP